MSKYVLSAMTTMTGRVCAVVVALVMTCLQPVFAVEATPEQIKALQKLMEQRDKVVPTSQQPPEFPDVVVPRTPDAGGGQPQQGGRGRDAGDNRVPAEKDKSRSPAMVTPHTPESGLPSTGKLEAFGYDLFAGVPTTFAPATDIPVPVDFIIGPGDTIRVQLFGKENNEYELVVSRDGTISFPGIGPVTVAGLRFDELKETLQTRISQQLIGVNANITLGPLRSIRIFVLGDVHQPGSYTVSALSTMTNALFVSGGVDPVGSLRNVQLKRSGKVVTRLDLYDLLLHGDTSGDARLQPGDVIFVPPLGKTLAVSGKVRRPAIYEIVNEKTAGEVVQLAGGLLPDAYPREARIERIREYQDRTLLNVDLSSTAGSGTPMRDGDHLHVFSVLEKMEEVVWLTGHVYRPGGYQWRSGMRLSELIPKLSDLKPDADLKYVLIKREQPPQRTLEVFSADLGAALSNPAGGADVVLQPRDEVIVFSGTGDRQDRLESVIQRLKQQAQQNHPAEVVQVQGRVRSPGDYPLEEGMRISDLIRAGGQLQEAAYALEAELSRRITVDGKLRRVKHVTVDLAAILAGVESADIQLKPHDFLNIKEIPHWREQETVEVSGEVRFPGTYPIRRGETLSELVDRVGGLTEYADAGAAVFTRDELQQRERKQMERMVENLERDLATLTLNQQDMSDQQKKAMGLITHLIGQLRDTQAVGRLVIDFPSIAEGNVPPRKDVVLQDGDELFIPGKREEVTVIGEVFFPTSHLYNKGLEADEYIDRSGGLTPKADRKRTYIIRANGEVVTNVSGGWLGASKRVSSGDTIVVPLDTHRVDTLRLWTDVSQVLYQLSITAVSLDTLGLF